MKQEHDRRSRDLNHNEYGYKYKGHRSLRVQIKEEMDKKYSHIHDKRSSFVYMQKNGQRFGKRGFIQKTHKGSKLPKDKWQKKSLPHKPTCKITPRLESNPLNDLSQECDLVNTIEIPNFKNQGNSFKTMRYSHLVPKREALVNRHDQNCQKLQNSQLY